MHSVAFTLSIIQPQDIFCHIKRLAASADLDICLITSSLFFSRMKYALMKGGHFVIYSGICSPFPAPSKLGHGWKQRSHLLSCFLYFLFQPPTLCLSSLSLSSSHKQRVSFLFDVQERWIKQSVTSTRGSTNVHMQMETKIWASVWITS